MSNVIPPRPYDERTRTRHFFYDILQTIAARELGSVDVAWLRKQWGDGPCYDPERHLFQKTTWTYDEQLWRRLCFAYTRWTLVSERRFWTDVLRLMTTKTSDFYSDEVTNEFRRMVYTQAQLQSVGS